MTKQKSLKVKQYKIKLYKVKTTNCSLVMYKVITIHTMYTWIYHGKLSIHIYTEIRVLKERGMVESLQINAYQQRMKKCREAFYLTRAGE